MEAKTYSPLLIPKFNKLYDSLRSDDGFRYLSDNYASGSINTSVNATVTGTVSLKNTPHYRLNQWPGAVQVYLMIRSFSIGPTTVPSGSGGMECTLIDNSGSTTPLCEMLSTASFATNLHALIPIPITDTDNTTVGTLSIALANVANSNGTYNYLIGFSYVYVLPAGASYGIEWKEGTFEYHDATNGVPDRTATY